MVAVLVRFRESVDFCDARASVTTRSRKIEGSGMEEGKVLRIKRSRRLLVHLKKGNDGLREME